jgi:hypothetical protein
LTYSIGKQSLYETTALQNIRDIFGTPQIGPQECFHTTRSIRVLR